MMYYNK